MSVVSIKQLLEAGSHFGHQTRIWNPKMKPYIYTERNGVHIIDLEQSVVFLDRAYSFVRDISSTGGSILFVGTKKQVTDAIKEEAQRCGQPYVSVRWPGGMLTNYKTIKNSLKRLSDLQAMVDNGTVNLLTKKEASAIIKEIEELERNYGGIKEMNGLPSAMFVMDTVKEHIAIQEAKKLGIPVIAAVDTNCNPDDADYMIPYNDDAIRAVRLLCHTMADAVIEGRQGEQLTDVPVEEESLDTVDEISISQ